MKPFEELRPRPYAVFVSGFYNGCKMYMVCGSMDVRTRYFHTKKECEKFIRSNYVGDEKRIRLYDLKRARL